MTAARLPDRALIRVEGPDARGLLNGLLTQEVEAMAVGALRYGALLTPQGRLVCDLFLLGEAEGALIDVNAGVRDALIAKLTLHRLRARCEIAAVSAPISAAWSEAPAGEGWVADPRSPEAGWRAYGVDAGGDADSYATHRFAHALPDAVCDGLADKVYATEANLDLLHGVDFHKGCFVGQETTSRMKRRGGIRSRVLPLDAPGTRAGDEVLAGALRAGEVMAVWNGRALALVRLDRVTSAPLTVRDAPATLIIPSWLPADSLAPSAQDVSA